MRKSKFISIMIVIVLILLPLSLIGKIHPAQAENGYPPRGEDGRRLDVDVVEDDNLPISEPEAVTPQNAIDATLGNPPALTQPFGSADSHQEPDQSLSPSLSSGQPLSGGELDYSLLPGVSVLDNFNRADGVIGSSWTVSDGLCNVSSNAAVCGNYGRATFNGYTGDGNIAEADVAVVGTDTQYTGLLLNYGAGSNNLFLKVQQQGSSGKFTHAACYTGNNNTPGFGLGFFPLPTPFSSAHMKATRVGNTVTIVFSNIENGAYPNQIYVCSGAPAPEGTGVGIVGLAGIARLDNFSIPSRCDDVLHNNGPLVTHPGGGFNGADASALQTALGMSSFGFGVQYSLGYRMADDFVVSNPGGWQVDYLTFYGYQTGAYADPPVSPLTGLYFQIWNGPPNDPGSSVVFGDLTTNRMFSSSWTGIYRVTDTAMTDASRPVMTIVAGAGVYLPPGAYWIDWMVDGTLTSGPWAPPVTILGQTTTGNAMQYTSAWAPANDAGPQGMPFIVRGCVEDTIWDQPLSAVNPANYIDQDFPDSPTFSSFLADDFIINAPVGLDTFFIPGGGWNGFTTLANASIITLQIHGDQAGIPAGDPAGGGDPPIWTLTLPISDPRITLYTGSGGLPSNLRIQLDTPISLLPGHYWFIFFPTMPFSPFGQFGLAAADTTNGYVGKFINPGGGFGFGAAWQDWSVIGPTLQQDIAFRLGGQTITIYLPLVKKQ
jgi:hypothetical protein